MTILLGILKVIGLILLICLILAILILLLILFVPIRYRAPVEVNDPDSHEEFPVSVLRDQSDVNAEVSWFHGALLVLFRYPAEKILEIKIFGRPISLGGKGEKQEETVQKEEKAEEEKPEETAESIIDRIDRICHMIDYFWRVLTGSCGRRAFEKIFRKLKNVVLSVMPRMWKLSGTLGLDDPCLNGRVAQANAVMMPFYEDHFQMNSQWEQYRVDLCAELSGKVVLFVPVKEFLPLIFDKDIKKVIKKLRRARAKFADVM